MAGKRNKINSFIAAAVFGLSFHLPSASASQSHSNVSLAQSYLKSLGFDAGPVDGLWGGKTERALANFLQRLGREWDGQLDQEEIGLLAEAYRATGAIGTVSTQVLEENFCEAMSAANGTYSAYFLGGRGDVRKFDGNGELSIGTLYYLSDPHFLKLNENKGYYFVTGIDEPGAQPNEELPILFGSPNGAPRSLFGHGSNIGLALKQVNLTGIHEVDVNNDGYDDLVVVDYGEHDLSELKGGTIRVALYRVDTRSYRTFFLDAPRQSNHRSVVVDVDRDGDLDIVVAGRIHGNDATSRRGFVTVYANDGSGRFVEDQRQLPNQRNRWFVDARDFNGDGFADLVMGGWGDVPHVILLDNTVSGRKIEIKLPGEDQELLSMTTLTDGNTVTAYFFSTSDYTVFNLFRVVIEDGRQRSAEKIWTADRNDRDFGFAHPNYIYGCNDGIYHFRQWPRSDYINGVNGFRYLSGY